MEKYGVEQVSVKTAKAGKPGSCPSCGGRMENKGRVSWCPNCGTKPYEEERNAEEEGGRSPDEN